MNKHTLLKAFLPASLLIWGQLAAQSVGDIDLSDVVVIEDATPTEAEASAEPVEVVEIPEAEIEGASAEVEAPVVPEVTEALPGDTDIVMEIPGQESGTPGEAKMETEETISVDFPDEDVRTILRNVADLFDLNLVIPNTLQGRTSIKLRKVSWNQVFDVVLDPFGYTYIMDGPVKDGGIIRIKSIEELAQEPVVTRAFDVNFADPSALVNSLQPLIDPAAGGGITPDDINKILIVTERPSKMNDIQALIGRIDSAAEKINAQVMIETKFVEVKNVDSKNIGVNWAFLNGYDVSAGGPDGFQRDWGRERSLVETTGTAINNSVSTASTSRVDTAVFSAAQFNLVLSALEEDNNSELMSNPTVVTMHNEKAIIEILTIEQNPETEFNEETGTSRTVGTTDEEYGTRIEVTPLVSPGAQFIDLIVKPSVSNKVSQRESEGFIFLTTSRRSVDTNVRIKNGFTLALGGLSQNEATYDKTKVPVLGDLPVVGRLFSGKNDNVQQTNLIVFITAKTLDPDGSAFPEGDAYREVVDPRIMDKMGITPSDLPGYKYKISEEQKELFKRMEQYRMDAETSKMIDDVKARIKQIESAKQQAEEESASGERK